ncbi:restriction endonuclease subunit S [Methanogenium cariaci]|jgi:type I restriction enzyme, S subunit
MSESVSVAEIKTLPADILTENFETLATAKGGIPKLRETILQLAVQGRLVPQNPEDEPASVLLKKIQAEKARLVKEGTIKKQKVLPPVDLDEVPYELPEGWVWTRLGDVSEIVMGNSPPGTTYNSTGNGCPLINGPVEFSFGPFGKTIETKYTTAPTKMCRKGDLLLCVRGSTTGRTNVAGFDSCIGRGVALIRPYRYNWYIYQFVHASEKNIFEKGTGSTFPSISQKDLTDLILPLPPLAEQHRIVERVDTLMQLCDELEARQDTESERRRMLLLSSLNALFDAKEPDEAAAAREILHANFDLLFDDTESIAELRKTILQLAVQGRLVEQHPEDEPASVLLEKIQAEKARLVKEGKIQTFFSNKKIPQIKDGEAPFIIPINWEWARLGDMCELITKGSSPKWQGINYVEESEGILFITSENVTNYDLKLNKKKYVEEKFNKIEPRSILKKDDFLMNLVGASIGRTAIYNVDEIANINQAVCLIRVISQNRNINLKYFLHFFNSPICISYMIDKQVDNARANLSMSNVSKFLIPLPPLAEQHRIVERVDTLMQLCDELEERVMAKEDAAERLLLSVCDRICG